METLNYQQTLDIVENFVIKTGIRDFCTNVCKGNCCGRCYTSENACHKHEGRRLACSAFVCQLPESGPKHININGFGHINQELVAARHVLNKAITVTYRKHNELKMKPHIQWEGEVYFYVPSPLLFTEFEVDALSINKCFVDLIDPVKKIVKTVNKAWKEAKSIPDEFSERWTSSKFSNFVIRDNKVVHYHMYHYRKTFKTTEIAQTNHPVVVGKKNKMRRRTD